MPTRLPPRPLPNTHLKVFRAEQPPRNHLKRIVAAKSAAEARRLFGGARPIEITDDHGAMANARTRPGVVLARVSSSDPWRAR